MLDALVADLEVCAEVHEVRFKAAVGAHCDDAPIGLGDVRDILASGSACGAQIRYTYQEQAWVDTLLATPRGIRWVRAIEWSPEGGEPQ